MLTENKSERERNGAKALQGCSQTNPHETNVGLFANEWGKSNVALLGHEYGRNSWWRHGTKVMWCCSETDPDQIHGRGMGQKSKTNMHKMPGREIGQK